MLDIKPKLLVSHRRRSDGGKGREMDIVSELKWWVFIFVAHDKDPVMVYFQGGVTKGIPDESNANINGYEIVMDRHRGNIWSLNYWVVWG